MTEALLEQLRQIHPEHETVDGWRSMDRSMPKAERPAPRTEPLLPDEVQAISAMDAILAIRLVTKQAVAHIAEKHDVTVDDVFSTRRTRSVCRARNEAIVFMRSQTGFGASKLGRIFRRDHSSILYALTTHQVRSGQS